MAKLLDHFRAAFEVLTFSFKPASGETDDLQDEASEIEANSSYGGDKQKVGLSGPHVGWNGSDESRLELEIERHMSGAYKLLCAHVSFLLSSFTIKMQAKPPGECAPLNFGASQKATNFDKIEQHRSSSDLRRHIVFNWSSRNPRALVIRLVFLLIIIRMTYDLLVHTVLLFEHDRSIQLLRNELTSDKQAAPLSRNCANWTQMSPTYQRLYEQTVEMSFKMNQYGVGMRSSTGIIFLQTLIIASTPFAYYLWPAWFLGFTNSIQSCAIASLLQPRLAMRRLRAEMHDILSGLHQGRTRVTTSRWMPDNFLHGHQLDDDRALNAEQIAMQSLMDSVGTRASSVPYVATVGWHATFIKASLFILAGYQCLSVMITILFAALTILHELWQHTEQRLAELQCNQSAGMGQLTRMFPPNPIILGLSPLSKADQGAFVGYLNSCVSSNGRQDNFWACTLARIELTFFVERKYLLGWRATMTLFEELFMLTCLCFWAVLWTSVFFLEFAQIVTTLLQVHSQLDRCIQLLIRQRERLHMPSHPEGDSERLELNERLAVTYLLYEFFRRHLRPFNKMAQFIIIQVGLFTLVSLAGLYLIATGFDSHRKEFVMAFTLIIICFMNIYLLAASFVPRRFEIVMLQIVRLLANLSDYQRLAAGRPDVALIGGASLVNIWQRQLLGTTDISRLSVAQLFGMHLSYKKLVALNVNLLGLWLLMWHV